MLFLVSGAKIIYFFGFPNFLIKNLNFLYQLYRVPEDFFKVLHLVVFYFYALFLQQLLHERGGREVRFAGEQPNAVDYAVRGYVLQVVRAAHRPAHHARRAGCAKRAGYCAVAGYPAARYEPCNGVNLLKKIILVFALWVHSCQK